MRLDPARVDLVACDKGRGVAWIIAADLSATVADLIRGAVVSTGLSHTGVGWQADLIHSRATHLVVSADFEVRLFEELKTLLRQTKLGG